jgi:O-succinylbenzoate synthase
MELVAPFVTSRGTETHQEHIIIKTESKGITGWGECVAGASPSYSNETIKTAWHILEDFLIPGIMNKNLQTVQDAVNSWKWIRGHRMAKAGLESAIWDVFAKMHNKSLSKILGGTRDKVEVGVSVGIQSSPDKLNETIEGYLREGYKRIKIKIAPGKDLEFISAVRNKFQDIMLQVDANSSYSLDDIDVFKEMDNFTLLMIEQPLGYKDIYEHSKLQKEIKTPVCLDESIHSFNVTKAAVELGSCKIINIKPGRIGGFTETKLIHDYCASKKIPVWHGGMLETGIGRAGNVALASLPNFTLPGDISASKRYYKEDIVEPPFEVSRDGMMNVPTEPGIGVKVVNNKLEKVTQTNKDFK